MAIPPEVTETIESAMSDTNDFMTAFTAGYLEAFVQKKLDDLMNDAVSAALPGAPGVSVDAFLGGGDTDDAGGDADADDAKAADPAEDGTPPIAAGVTVVKFRLLTGPDKAQHRYYDIAAVAVKPQNSVIRRITRTHRVLLRDHAELLEEKDAPTGLDFPKKKWGKKDDSYYRTRLAGMQEFYEAVSSSPASLSEKFLVQFDLKADPKREERLEIFKSALDAVCEEKGISLESALDRAEDIGVESEEPELLKLVCVEAIGNPATERITNAINENMPGFVPQKVKNKVVNKSDSQLASVIATAIEAQWTAMGPIFEQLAIAVQKALDAGAEPIGNVINGAVSPIGDFIKSKFGDGTPPEPSIGRDIALDRYPWIVELLNGLESGKAAAALKVLEKKVNTFGNKQDFAGYLVYDFGPDWVRDLDLPYLEDIADPHERLVDALLEAWEVLAVAGVKALKPIFEFKDTMASNFDAAAFQDGLRNAVRQGGQALAKDYFDLPKKLRRAVWRLGSAQTQVVLSLAQKTVELMVNSLGQLAVNWNPQSASEVTPSFIDSLKQAAFNFGNTTATRFLTTVLVSTQLSLVNLAMAEFGEGIADVISTLDGLVGSLPDPLPTYVKPGAICNTILNKLIYKAAFFGIMKIAKPSHDAFYSVGGVRTTILHVEPSGAASATSPRSAAAEEAAADANVNTSGEEDNEDDAEAGGDQ